MKKIDEKTWRRLAIIYFVVLAAAMWVPLGGLHLNRMVLGFRLDHLLHLAVYMPCAFAWAVLLPRHRWFWLVLTLLVGAGLEASQYVLPYRGFDLTDMVANATGALIGWVVLLVWRRRHDNQGEASY